MLFQNNSFPLKKINKLGVFSPWSSPPQKNFYFFLAPKNPGFFPSGKKKKKKRLRWVFCLSPPIVRQGGEVRPIPEEFTLLHRPHDPGAGRLAERRRGMLRFSSFLNIELRKVSMFSKVVLFFLFVRIGC